ncbi:MAG TPA: hypothetical protein GXX38_06250, partial [Clostridia bacterium]|nr:hypothetical protein [Clostridia bacterium]
GEDIVFLRKIVPGGSDRSYGIHVARLAGLPSAVIENAKKILHRLENSALLQEAKVNKINEKTAAAVEKKETFQKSNKLEIDPKLASLLKELKNLDINNLTPLSALNKLNDLKTKVEQYIESKDMEGNNIA